MAEYKDHRSEGNLYVNEYHKKGDKKPPFTGYLEVTKEQIEQLINKGKRGEKTNIQLALWKYPSKRNPNEVRLFLSANVAEKISSGISGESFEDFDDDMPF